MLRVLYYSRSWYGLPAHNRGAFLPPEPVLKWARVGAEREAGGALRDPVWLHQEAVRSGEEGSASGTLQILELTGSA